MKTQDLVDDYLVAYQSYRQRDQGHTLTGWRSSSLGYCPRRQTYDRLGLKGYSDFDAKTLRTFSYGDTIHDWLKRIFRNSGLLIEEEGKLADDERSLKGHYDMLVGGPPQDIEEAQRERWSPWWTEWIDTYRASLAESFADPTLAEIKSINPRAFKFLKKDGPKRAHQLQLGSYFSMVNNDPSLVPVEPTAGRLIYIGKDNDAPILDFTYEEAWTDEADAVVQDLNTYWDAREVPPCTCAGWEVGYCRYLLPESRDFRGKAKKDVVGGDDCCPPDLYESALEAHDRAVEAQKEDAENGI